MDIFKQHHLIQAYLTRYKNSSTNEREQRTFEHFCKYLAGKGIGHYEDVSLDLLEEYHRKIANASFAPSVIRFHLQWVRRFFKYLEKKDLIFISPADALQMPKEIRAPKTVLSEEELKKLFFQPDINTPIRLRDYTMLKTSYTCCLNGEELLGLGILDVNFKNRELFIQGNKKRILPMERQMMLDLKYYIKEARSGMIKNPDQTGLWLSARSGNTLSKVHLKRIFYFYGKKAGIRESVSPHALRRAGAVRLLKKGITPEELVLRLGYKAVKNLPRYVAMNVSEMRKLNKKAVGNG